MAGDIARKRRPTNDAMLVAALMARGGYPSSQDA